MSFLPEFSIVIPIYKCSQNQDKLIEYLVEETVNKTINLEFIFVIDGCNENYQFTDKLTQFKSVKEIYINKNRGQYHATITGINHARGNFIITLDADVFHHKKLLKILLNSNIDVDIVYINMNYHGRKLFRSVASFVLKIIIFYKTQAKIFKNGSSFRKIKKSYFQQVKSEILSNIYSIDIVLLNKTDKVRFIEYNSKEKIVSSYTFSSLLKLLKNIFIKKEPYESL